MIVGIDEVPTLTKDTKKLIADFGEGHYFSALKALIEYEILIKIRETINNPATPDNIRSEQIGRENGIIELLQRVKQIQEEMRQVD